MSSHAEKLGARCFFAVIPEGLPESPSVREILKKLKVGADQKEIEIKWVPPDKWHITAYFLGSVSAEKRQSLETIGAEVASQNEAFELDIEGVGAFPVLEAGRVLWLGVARHRELRVLSEALRERLVAAGWAEDEREFIPHVTLGRLRNPRHLRDYLSPVQRRRVGTFWVRELSLFSSEVFGQHVVYQRLATWKLGAKLD